MAKTNVGKCRLCLKEGAELQDSHFFPAAIYKAMREENNPNPHPVVVTPNGAKQTSYQQKAPLLCRDCEQRFSTMGENWTLAHFLRGDGTFALAGILKSHTPVLGALGDQTKIYLTSSIPEIDRNALVYFAASMFWRGSIHPWKTDGTYPVNLGRLYGEEFRLFLLGQQPFPLEASLWIVVREGGKLANLAYNPAGGRMRSPQGEDLGYSYRFPMPGFVFTLTVGKGRLDLSKQFCIVRGDGNPIIVSSKTEEFIEKDAYQMGRRAEEAVARRAGRKRRK